MNPHLQALIAGKRKWNEPLRPEDIAQGFKGWYSSKYLPHFDSPGAQQYITYRLADSMPAERRHEWEHLLRIEDDLGKQRQLEAYLDLGYGPCYLHQHRIADLVQRNFWYHDGRKYRLLAWVIMPNHIHALIEIWRVPLGQLVKNWKSYTAKKANHVLRAMGAFWEEDYFDRYIRDEAHFCRVVRYIENNPVKAGLVKLKEDWPWSSARYRSHADLSARTLTHPGAERVPPPP